MKLICLGTGGFIPTERAQTACYMLPEVGVLLDAGSGLYRMNRYLQTPELDVYLTHAHGDHTCGLIYLFASFFIDEVHHAPIPVDENNINTLVAKANHRLHAARIHAAKSALDHLAKEYAPYRLNLRVIQPQEDLPGGGLLTSFSVSEFGEIGFRIDYPGHSMAYVTDTTARPDAPYLPYIRGVDLLVHECNGPDNMSAMMAHIHHSTTTPVARLAAEAQVKQLILVHQNPLDGWSIDVDLESARKIFPSTLIGVDGMEVEF